MRARYLTAALLVAMPGAALAHTGVGTASGFWHGFAHPVSGIDHVLAMVLVGILAARTGGRGLWLVPSSFVLVMAAGGALGALGVEVPLVEAGIAMSVVVLGAMIAFGSRPPVAAAAGLVALFAVFHGHAHGAEMPEDAGGLGYAAGFMLATALLHAAGVGVGLLLGRPGMPAGPVAVRVAAGVAALAGVGLLTGAV